MMDGLHLRIGHDGRVPSPYLFSDSNGLKHFKDTWLLLYKMSGREKRERKRGSKGHPSVTGPSASKCFQVEGAPDTHRSVFYCNTAGLGIGSDGSPPVACQWAAANSEMIPPPSFFRSLIRHNSAYRIEPKEETDGRTNKISTKKRVKV